MRFIAPPGRLTEAAVEQAYLSGLDKVPAPVQASRQGDELALHRVVSESASLHLLWPVDGYGQILLTTGTLREREAPYQLPLELARGKVSQVRHQLFDWQSAGMVVPDSARQRVQEATRLIGRAAIDRQNLDASAELAEEAIRVALDAGGLLAGAYAEQALAVRRRVQHKLPSFLGANLGGVPLEEYTARQVLQTFNAAVVPFVWKDLETSDESFNWDVSDKQIQWCRDNGLTVIGGPLVLFDNRSIPDWLAAGNFPAVLDAAAYYIEAVVNRYRSVVEFWIAAGRVNTGELLGFGEEEKVRLTARSLELIRSLDAGKRALISFDQPWGEYLLRRPQDFPPLHFADALIRAGIGVTGLVLEINLGYRPGGTMCRDPLEFGRQVDYWSMLGVPLYLALTVPSGSSVDPLAQRRVVLPPDHWTSKSQQTWVTRNLPLLLSKPSVQGIYWNQLRDSEPHDFPHGGLFDLRRHPKPVLRQLESLRQAHLR
ncbi:MAG: hypothetical protein GXY83_14435 [Rhodopirellula sp.]|nr:hypothetical protein [Rhodopirellula sp.]